MTAIIEASTHSGVRAVHGANRARAAYSMRALGRSELPAEFTLNGVAYRHERTVKHDFFAATGFYRNLAGKRVVLKIGRVAEFAGLPLQWIGKWLCRREIRFYTSLCGVPHVPAMLGAWGETGFVHEYVPGRPLSDECDVPDHFFDRLAELFNELHQRRIAYVDANKPQNILLGDDGLPYLIDFQISWDLVELGDTALNRWWLSKLQREDLAHLLKHKRRLRPDEMTGREWDVVDQRSRLIRLHRMISRPWFKIRRRTLSRLRATGQLLPEGSK